MWKHGVKGLVKGYSRATLSSPSLYSCKLLVKTEAPWNRTRICMQTQVTEPVTCVRVCVSVRQHHVSKYDSNNRQSLSMTNGQLIELSQTVCKLELLSHLSCHLSSTQGGQGSPGGPGQHSGQDHSLCHR